MEDLSYLRLEALQLEQSTGLLRVDYSTEEREGKLLYRFRIPSSSDAAAGILPTLESGYVQESALELRDLGWPELPARVSRDALEWLRAQRKAAQATQRSELLQRIAGHVDALERTAA